MGVVGLALAAIALFLSGLKSSAPSLRRVGFSLVLVGALACLGPQIAVSSIRLPNPIYMMMEVVPGFTTLRAPLRFGVVAHLGLSVLTGVGVQWINERVGVRPWPVVVGLGILSVWLASPIPVPALHGEVTEASLPPHLGWLKQQHSRAPIFEIPRAADYASEAQRAYLSTFLWQPILDGYAANGPRHSDYLQWIARKLPSGEALQDLVDLVDVGWIIVHRTELTEAQRATWVTTPLPDGLTLEYSSSEVEVLRVTRASHTNRRARLLSSVETLNGVPIRPIGEHCSLAIESLEWVRRPSEGDYARLAVVTTNTAGEPLPALGFYPANLLELEVSVRSTLDTIEKAPWSVRLNDDLRPFEKVRTVFRVDLPQAAGTYKVVVKLMQHGQPPLIRCGNVQAQQEFTIPGSS